MHALITTVLLVALVTVAAGDDLEPWASNTHPTDAPRCHVEEVTAGEHRYTVVHGGTMDGQNCRSPMGCGIAREGAIEQTWQSNRAVRMENVAETDVINPWLSNGRNSFRSLDEIVDAAVKPGMSDKEKALALWFQQIRQRFHWVADGQEMSDAVKVYNVYGYNPCGSEANIMGALWGRAGLKAAPARLAGHSVAQVYYDGGWHMLDADLQHLFLLRDNETVASDRELARDHDLVKRTHTLGILLGDDRTRDEGALGAAMFICEDEITGERGYPTDTTMNMTLRPGEALVWRWGHVSPAKWLWDTMPPPYPDTVCNGLWEYRPDFTRDTWRRGAAAVESITSGPDGLTAEAGRAGTIVWTMRSPYVFVGGRLEVEGSGAEFSLSWDGKVWHPVERSLDRFFPPDGTPRYQYQLRCRLSGEATLKRLSIVNDLQMALLALPEMVVGENAFVYTDESPGAREVRITHEWVERSASSPPQASPAPVYPPDGGEANGTDIVFQWQVPADPDGDAIADYHFELSDRADMKWPLSMNFYKLVSRTADKGKAQYTLPYPGLLTPDTQYYWHVRAKDAMGVWGPWSATWRFTPRGPACPLGVTVEYDQSKNPGVLRWKPNPVGRRPAKYRIYGSDEKGFSVSDEPYDVVTGITQELHPQFLESFPQFIAPDRMRLPANFIAETTAAELAVVGTEVNLPGANKAYYRVVAVDEQGGRSGPSDYASAPRPVIYLSTVFEPLPGGVAQHAGRPQSITCRKPALSARVGTDYRCLVSATRSLGDLQSRGGPPRFWDIEKPRYSLEQGPRWLHLDETTGLLSGIPDAAGEAEVVVTATIEREVRKLDLEQLGWGRVRALSATTQEVGTTRYRFVIEVRE